ncbi:MAG: hypothetical protein WCK35_15815 [Chloroflexota bacterium]
MELFKKIFGSGKQQPDSQQNLDNPIADSPNWITREAYAKDPQANPKKLEQYIRNDPVMEVRMAACKNPNVPVKVLEEFGSYYL